MDTVTAAYRQVAKHRTPAPSSQAVLAATDVDTIDLPEDIILGIMKIFKTYSPESNANLPRFMVGMGNLLLRNGADTAAIAAKKQKAAEQADADANAEKGAPEADADEVAASAQPVAAAVAPEPPAEEEPVNPVEASVVAEMLAKLKSGLATSNLLTSGDPVFNQARNCFTIPLTTGALESGRVEQFSNLLGDAFSRVTLSAKGSKLALEVAL